MPFDEIEIDSSSIKFDQQHKRKENPRAYSASGFVGGVGARLKRKISGCNELALCFYAFNIKINCRFFLASFISFLFFLISIFIGKHFPMKKFIRLYISVHEICDMFFRSFIHFFSPPKKTLTRKKMFSMSEMFVGKFSESL